MVIIGCARRELAGNREGEIMKGLGLAVLAVVFLLAATARTLKGLISLRRWAATPRIRSSGRSALPWG